MMKFECFDFFFEFLFTIEMSNCNRIIALIDMDCFYVQCEQRLEPDKWLKPCAVAQYNNWKGN
mgnify:FL=1